MLTPLIGFDSDELRSLMLQDGEALYRGSQIAEWVYRRGARELDQMTDLPGTLRRRLAERYEVGRSRVAAAQRSTDGTVKLLLAMGDGQAIETVGLPYEGRFSCCVSSQAGCPVRCAFCATGMSGYTRNLSAGEIVDQVLTVAEHAAPRRAGAGQPHRVSHVVFMGMGEPLMNFHATLKAVRLLNQEVGIGMRSLTVSTVGFVPGIRRLAREDLQLTLAVSLHAPSDGLRRQLIPTMTRWSVGEIIGACRDYIQRTGRRVTFEYCLLEGVNDGVAEARELGRLLQGLNGHVNLIPFNAVHGLPLKPSPRDRIAAFRQAVEETGVAVTQRVQRGADIDAACGQLKRAATPLASGALDH